MKVSTRTQENKGYRQGRP